MDKPAEGSLVGDIVAAVVVNLLTYIPAISPLVLFVPMGFVGVYCLVVGLYAYWQIRKGRRRRAVLAGLFAAAISIFMMMAVRIA